MTSSSISRGGGIERERVLREREVVDLFMACGIFESTAKDIVKSLPELNGMTEKQGEIFKGILREASSLLEKESQLPELIPLNVKQLETEKLLSEGNANKKVKLNLCKICKDTAAIHPSFPEHMKRFFRRTQYFRGELTKEDWLCRGCYADWYRENRDLMHDIQSGTVKYEEDNADDNNSNSSEEAAERLKIRKKERYIKAITIPLWFTVKYLDPKAIGHRKMLVRYITLNQIRFNQVAAALWYLRKVGNGILDQEEFEKRCGIGQYEDLFGYSIWKDSFAKREILRLDENDRKKRREEKRIEREREAAAKLKQEQEEAAEAKRQQHLKETIETAEREAEEGARAEKWRKLKEQRKKEDEELSESRKTAEALKSKRQEKHEADLKKKKQARDLELKQAELALKKREEELQKKKEERYRKQRQEALQRQAERKQTILESSLKK